MMSQLRGRAHRPRLLPGRPLVGARVVAGVVFDDELVRDGLQPHEVMLLADHDLAARVELRTDLSSTACL